MKSQFGGMAKNFVFWAHCVLHIEFPPGLNIPLLGLKPTSVYRNDSTNQLMFSHTVVSEQETRNSRLIASTKNGI